MDSGFLYYTHDRLSLADCCYKDKGNFTQSYQDQLVHQLSPLAAQVSLAWPVPGL